MSTGFNDCEVECARLRVALAAAQATNAKLREALQERLAQEQERKRVEAESQAHMLHDCDVIVQRLMGG